MGWATLCLPEDLAFSKTLRHFEQLSPKDELERRLICISKMLPDSWQHPQPFHPCLGTSAPDERPFQLAGPHSPSFRSSLASQAWV